MEKFSQTGLRLGQGQPEEGAAEGFSSDGFGEIGRLDW